MDEETRQAVGLILTALTFAGKHDAEEVQQYNNACARLSQVYYSSEPSSDSNTADGLERYGAAFPTVFNIIQKSVYQTAVDHGWWEEDRSSFELQMLIVSELAEACEATRRGNPPSDHIPEFSGEEEEYADAIIRIMSLAERRGLKIAEALIAKALFNESRPYRHGGKLH